jgi:hypothetical protein
MIALLLALMITASIALACDQTFPVDPMVVAELLPGYVHVDSIDDGDVLRLLMRNTEDELVFVGGILTDNGWHFTESAPLPEGTILGVENFTHSLGIPGKTYYTSVSVRPYADGTWGISLIYPEGDAPLFFFAQHVVYGDVYEIEGHFGDHPWSDIAAIDWTTLPATLEEAVARINRSDWAVVSNPNPEDRLHLRATPDQDAVSYGKYYNCTPVRIREYGKTWCAVTVCGIDGYMMTKYLAFGEDMDTVDYAGPWLTRKEHLSEVRLYESPRAASKYIMHPLSGVCIMGVAGDYYHVWLPDTEEYGYVRMDDLWEGNG